MPRIVTGHIDGAPVTPFPSLVGVAPEGVCVTHAVITDPVQPLHMWMHELSAGAAIGFATPVVAHTMFVVTGEVEANGALVPKEGAVIVEHNAETTVRAVGPARLLHFHRPENHPERTERKGGHVHTGGPDGNMKGG